MPATSPTHAHMLKDIMGCHQARPAQGELEAMLRLMDAPAWADSSVQENDGAGLRGGACPSLTGFWKSRGAAETMTQRKKRQCVGGYSMSVGAELTWKNWLKFCKTTERKRMLHLFTGNALLYTEHSPDSTSALLLLKNQSGTRCTYAEIHSVLTEVNKTPVDTNRYWRSPQVTLHLDPDPKLAVGVPEAPSRIPP